MMATARWLADRRAGFHQAARAVGVEALDVRVLLLAGDGDALLDDRQRVLGAVEMASASCWATSARCRLSAGWRRASRATKSTPRCGMRRNNARAGPVERRSAAPRMPRRSIAASNCGLSFAFAARLPRSPRGCAPCERTNARQHGLHAQAAQACLSVLTRIGDENIRGP